MANSKDIQKVASGIAASSKISPTAAGRPKSTPTASPELIDAINQVFALFRANYHNQYYSAFGDKNESVGLAKKLWLSKLNDFAPTVICAAAEKIIADSEYLPTLHKMLNACRYVGMPAGLPTPRKAYQEACNKRSPKAEQSWSHPAVYLAGRDAGWHMLANAIETKALPAYSEIYQQYCDRIISGEKLAVDLPPALPEVSQMPATKKHNQQQLKNLKKLLD